MRFLEIARANLGRRNVRRDRQDWNARTLTIEQAIDEVEIPRAAASRTNGQCSGKVRFGAGGKSGNFLMADVDPFDLALSADRVRDAIQAVTNDAVNAFHAGGGEGLSKLICDGFHHRGPPLYSYPYSFLESPKRLTESERKGLNAGIQEFDLKNPVFYLTLLPDKLIETGLSNLTGAVRADIHSAIVTGSGPV